MAWDQKWFSKMKNGKVAGPSGLVFEMVKSAGRANLINKIKVGGAITVERELGKLKAQSQVLDNF